MKIKKEYIMKNCSTATTGPDDKITLSVPSKSGLTLVVPGLIISGSSYPVRAFASTGSVVMISGYVNRIT